MQRVSQKMHPGINIESSKRKMNVHLQGSPMGLATDFSSETMAGRRQWDDI